MKNNLKIVPGLIVFLFFANVCHSQDKTAYINANQLMQEMPEYKLIQLQLDGFQKTFTDKLAVMGTEFDTRLQEYQAKKASMADAARTAAETDLQAMQKRVNLYQDDAKKQIADKNTALTNPLIEKIRNAITKVAKAKGFANVIDSSSLGMLVLSPDDDLLKPVEAELGIK